MTSPFHVGVLLDNVPEYVFLLGGAALAGATVVGINPTRRGDELAHDIRHTDCGLVVHRGRVRTAFSTDLDLGIAADRILTVESDAWHAVARRARRCAHTRRRCPGPETLFVLIFTSGSTGAPKAVRGTQGRFARSGARMPFGPDDVLYCPMPLFHGNALASNFVPAVTLGRDDRAAPQVLGVGVLRRHPPRRRDVLQHRRSRAVVRARDTTVARRSRSSGQVRARTGVVAGRRRRVPRAFRYPARRRLRLERRRDHHHARARRQARRARCAGGGHRRRGRRSRDRDECARAEFDEHGALTQRRRSDRRDRAARPPPRVRGLLQATTTRPRNAAATAGTGRATSATATPTASSTSRAAPPTGSASTARTSPRRRSNASSSVTPPWPRSRSTACPIPSPATR